MAGFGYFQREAGYTRTGSPNSRVHGRKTGRWHEADLAVAAAAAARDVTLLVNNAGSARAGGLVSWSWRNLRAARPT